MGLDMYLSRKIHIGAQYSTNEISGEINITKKGVKIPVDLYKIDFIAEEVAYWRKANQIHSWFVLNVQNGIDDCKAYELDIEKLTELLEKCKKIQKIAKFKKGKILLSQHWDGAKWQNEYKDGLIIENVDEIEEILPTKAGFFFGNTEYNELYMRQINNTINILETIIQEHKQFENNNIYCYYEYCSSW